MQNLLLAATARGTGSFWSSGGPLREAEAFGWMGIPAGEVALGSIFTRAGGHRRCARRPRRAP